jgi:hypothetical protein
MVNVLFLIVTFDNDSEVEKRRLKWFRFVVLNEWPKFNDSARLNYTFR